MQTDYSQATLPLRGRDLGDASSSHHVSSKEFFFLDQVLTYAILAAGAASTEVLFLAYHGDRAVTWSAASGSFSRFCHKATVSVVITILAVACYAMLSLVSSYRLFSRFDAPIACTTEGVQIPNLQGS